MEGFIAKLKMALNSVSVTVKRWLISLHPWRFEAKNNCVTTLFAGPSTDEQQSSKKASVICQVEKPSSSEKRLQKGILES